MGVPATREWVSALVSKSLRAATGGGDKPPKALSELTDVVVTSPSNDDVLVWDETSQMWMNKTVPSGTKVEGNPTDPATAELKKIKIGEDIFSIPEGGSGGGANRIIDSLFNSESDPETITLAKSYKEYDELLLLGYSDDRYFSSTIYPVPDLKTDDKIGIHNDDRYVWYKIAGNTALTKNGQRGSKITTIYGIKYIQGDIPTPSGGGGLTKEMIFEGPSVPGSDYQLAKSINDFDALYIFYSASNGCKATQIILKEDYIFREDITINHIFSDYGGRFTCAVFKNDKTLYVGDTADQYIEKIYGLKFGSGDIPTPSGGGGKPKYAYLYNELPNEQRSSGYQTPVVFDKQRVDGLKVEDGKIYLEKDKTYQIIANTQNQDNYGNYIYVCNKNLDTICVNGANKGYQSATASAIYTCESDDDYIFLWIEDGYGHAGSYRSASTNIMVVELSGGGGGSSSDYIEYDEETETIKFKDISGGGESKPAIHEYSLEEQIVGKWVDGRNIYERTYVFDTYKEYGGWATFVVDDIFTDYELKNGIVSCETYPGGITSANGAIIRIRGNILELYCAWGTATNAITIQYTKKSERS